MAITLAELAAASHGPAPGPTARPNMLSVGDSLMWGQGLLPAHRFRELVRLRLAQEGDPVVELAMGRSGAKLDPAHNPGVGGLDNTISVTLASHPAPPIDPLYSPSQLAREVPHAALTTRRQLLEAEALLQAARPAADPTDIRWIILDGGINDMGFGGFLLPFNAYLDGYLLSGWASWLLDQARVIEAEMVETLREAVRCFPRAAVVVNGYFPVFSYHSLLHAARAKSIGILYNLVTLPAVITPFTLDMLATGSSTWQAASNRHLRRAVRQVAREHPRRTLLFARSNIEGPHCLFALDSWLWEYDAIPDGMPQTADQWTQWLAMATPEDEVIEPRLARCKALTQGRSEAISCRLASMGHPNVAGAIDYARSISEALEDAGVIRSDLHECALGRRRWKKKCTEFSDDWAYRCVSIDASIGEACGTAIKGVRDQAIYHVQQVGDHLKRAGAHLVDAAACFADTPGKIAKAASSQFSNAGDHLKQAGTQVRDSVRCWDQTAIEIQQCDDTEASGIAACNAEFSARVNGPCHIHCTRFTNCNRYGKYNPLRYACRTARAGCVAAATVARGTCVAGAVAIREACTAVAGVQNAACKALVVLGNTVCSTVEVGKALGNVVVAGFQTLGGVIAAVAVISEASLCAIIETTRAVVDVGIAAGHVGGAILFGSIAGGIFVGCGVGRWFVNRGCRLGNWAAQPLCKLGVALIEGLCWLTLPFKALARASRMGD